MDAAIEQARRNIYPDMLAGLDVPILLVGATYDSDTRERACSIQVHGEAQ